MWIQSEAVHYASGALTAGDRSDHKVCVTSGLGIKNTVARICGMGSRLNVMGMRLCCVCGAHHRAFSKVSANIASPENVNTDPLLEPASTMQSLVSFPSV